MNYFCVAALISGVLFTTILKSGLSNTLYHFARPHRISRKFGSLVSILILIAVMLSLALLFVIYFASRFHPVTMIDNPLSLIISSDAFRSTILGVLFSAIFIHWVDNFHAVDDKRVTRSQLGRVSEPDDPEDLDEPRKSRFLIVEGYLLLGLFIFGSADLIQSIFGRIDTFKAGLEGVEFSLRAGDAISRPLPQLSTEQISGGSAGYSAKSAPSLAALSFLSDVGDMVTRDDRYLQLYDKKPSGGKAGLLTLNQAGVGDKLKKFSVFVSALASCQAVLWSARGSNRLSLSSYSPLEEPIHDFAYAVAHGISYNDNHDLVNTFGDIAKEYTTLTIDTINQAVLIGAFDKDKNTVRLKRAYYSQNGDQCIKLLENICPSGNYYLEDSRKKAGSNGYNQASVGLSQVGCKYFDISGNVYVNMKDRGSIIQSSIMDVLAVGYTHGEWFRTPYAAIISACVSSIIGDHATAIDELRQWLNARSDEKNWYDLRANLILSSLMEYWLNADEISAANVSLENFHLNNMKQIIHDLGAKNKVGNEQNYWEPGHRWKVRDIVISEDADGTAIGLDRSGVGDVIGEGDEDRECAAHRNSKTELDMVILDYTRVTYMMQYVDRAFRQPDFAESGYGNNVEAMLSELNGVRFGCLSLFSRDPFLRDVESKVASSRAKLHQFNALWQMYRYEALEKILTVDEKRKTLSAALDSAKRALGVLDRVKDTDETGKNSNHDFAPSVVLQERVKVRALEADLARSLDSLGPK